MDQFGFRPIYEDDGIPGARNGARAFGIPVTKEKGKMLDSYSRDAKKQRFIEMYFAGDFLPSFGMNFEDEDF